MLDAQSQQCTASALMLPDDWGKFFMLFLPTREIQQLRKIRRRSGVSGAGFDYLDYKP
ncbi:hypothetical protein [Nostoc sp.]|uniref:hypothetical protein n=1 Tax=Nostoc sp. TaxID=1180 RepID=UPI002FF1CBD5